MITKFKIISREYYSNYMIEALKAKLFNSRVKIYFCKPRITQNRHFQMFHFMWSDGKADYDFSDLNDNEMPWYKDFIFKGVIRKFDLGFVEKYAKYRNKKVRNNEFNRICRKHISDTFDSISKTISCTIRKRKK